MTTIDERSKYIDKQIKELKDVIYNPTQKVSLIHKERESNLLTLINEKETIMYFLTEQLEKVEKEKADLEEKLECLRYTSN